MVGSKFRIKNIERGVYEQAQDYFDWGETVLNINISNISSGALPELTLPPDEVVYVNFTKQAGELKKEVSGFALSPFLPSDVCESLDGLRTAIDGIFTTMIAFLNESPKSQKFRMNAAINDPTVAAGLYNEFLDRVFVAEDSIIQLRETIRKELSDD